MLIFQITQGQLSKNNLRKIAIIFLSISLNMCLRAQKDETVLLRTHIICFGWEKRKIIFS